MAADHWYSALGFWGVWLFVPILVDGFQAFRYLLATVTGRAKRLPIRPVTKAPQGKWPRVSILIPVYNSEEILAACIDSIRKQSYPGELIEILAIDNGSRDHSWKVFCEKQQENFPGAIHWLSTFHQGKPWALNVGIHYAHGEYVINMDSDIVLHEDAIVNMVAAFENDSDLIAATGAVEIRPEVNERGFMRVVHECEFQEYYFGFNVGRRFESQAKSLFTLAGAFSGFRREVLLNTFLYDTSTVGEDTFMTFELQELYPGKKVSVVTSSVCYTDPIPSLRALYAQRVRWQRGEIEVIAAHPKLAKRGLFYRGFAPARTLLVDHTLAFPRITWTFLMPGLVFFGYEVSTVVLATIALYAAYTVIEAATWATSALLVVPPSSNRLWRGWWTIPLMPAYRYSIFWLRFAGVLTVITEGQQWRTTDPVTASKAEFLRVVGGSHEEAKKKAA